MALANYTDLKAAVAAWLNRADLTTEIPDFIQQAEESFNNTLRVPEGEVRANLTITGEYVTAPADFLEFRNGYIDTAPRIPLAYLGPDAQTAAHANTGIGIQQFSRAGNEFRFDPLVATGDAVIVYYAKIPPLSLNATNWLLTRAPTLYLYESCLHGAIRIQDDDRAMRAAGLVGSLRSTFEASGARSRWGGPAMAMRVA